MESGFSYRPVTVRRNGSQDVARSVMGEFVSGNYFRTFGLRPAGRSPVHRFRRRERRADDCRPELSELARRLLR